MAETGAPTRIDTSPAATTSPVVAASGGAATPDSSADVAGYFDAYASFARTLRTWLVGFGVGVPVVVASQADLSKKLTDSGDAPFVVTLFLAGVSIQIGAALLYKTTMWYTYMGAAEPAFRGSKRYRAACMVSDQYWLEIGFDFVSIGLFVVAMFTLLKAVFKAAI
jgi:hypothetical protein